MEVVELCRKEDYSCHNVFCNELLVLLDCWVVVVDILGRAKSRGCYMYRGGAAEISVDKYEFKLNS